MPKKKGKSVSFDAMVKFFMHAYHIPTKRDIERLEMRLDRIERLLSNAAAARVRRAAAAREPGRQNDNTAANLVLDVIRRFPEGVDFSEIQTQTGFAEKKLRNAIFRLYKLKKIKRKSRGIYIEA